MGIDCNLPSPSHSSPPKKQTLLTLSILHLAHETHTTDTLHMNYTVPAFPMNHGGDNYELLIVVAIYPSVFSRTPLP